MRSALLARTRSKIRSQSLYGIVIGEPTAHRERRPTCKRFSQQYGYRTRSICRRSHQFPSNNFPSGISGVRHLCTSVNSSDVVFGEEWPEHEFSQLAEACLEHISEEVSEFGFESENSLSDFDIDFSQGVLTISLGTHGTYVINTQTPNRQIWMSSPTSGPSRYSWHPHDAAWVSSRDGHQLAERLSDELSKVFEGKVVITFAHVGDIHR